MDEQTRQNLRRERRKNEENKKEDYFSAVTITQIVLCIILALVIFFTSKGDTAAAQNLKSDFNRLMGWTFNSDDAQNVMKSVKDYLSQSMDSETATAEAVTEPHTQEETENSKAEPATMKKVASSDNSNMGGEDISYKAKEKTSFAPVTTTCPIVAPVDSKRYTSYFGYRTNPISNEHSFHTGLDIAAPLGTKIKAAYGGTVRKTGEDSHSGKYIFLTHDDGFETFYCHCNEILAEQGAVIRQGETIAKVGSTGWSTGPHLHFEIRKDGTRLNPLWILEGKNQ